VQLTVSKWLSWGSRFLISLRDGYSPCWRPPRGARVLKPPPLLFVRHRPLVFSNLTALFLNSLEAGANLLHVSSIILAYSASWYFATKNQRHNYPMPLFRRVSALKGPQNVASGNARRVPDPRPGPNPERVAGLPPPGCDSWKTLFRTLEGRGFRPAVPTP